MITKKAKRGKRGARENFSFVTGSRSVENRELLTGGSPILNLLIIRMINATKTSPLSNSLEKDKKKWEILCWASESAFFVFFRWKTCGENFPFHFYFKSKCNFLTLTAHINEPEKLPGKGFRFTRAFDIVFLIFFFSFENWIRERIKWLRY